MAKYRIHYKICLIGDYFVEAHSLGLAYEQMYKTFEADNSLIVHADAEYGFEIMWVVPFEHKFSKPGKPRVTTTEELKAALNRDTLEVIEVVKPVVLADTGLFDFDAGADPKQS